ncbi:MAG: ABC transporter ATP-binding protein [Candidatus Thorarchaeota archaeon]
MIKISDNETTVQEDSRLASPLIELVDLEKQYMMGKVPVDALCGINLSIDPGEFIAILGPSGSGKSTMLNMIGALDKPSKGIVKIEGVDLTTMNESQLANIRRRIGFVFQFFNLIPRLNARESVELPMAIQGISRRERSKRAEELLAIVGLGDRIEHKPSELSGGERQRVAIARALANEPTFLLLDEPTGNIDSKTANELLQLIADLNEKNKITMIMITHDQTIAKYAKREIHLLDGKFVKEVTK